MRRLACVFILIVCAGPVMAFGQAASANLTGTAKDTSGAVLPGVTITAVNAGTNDTRTTVTSADGLYRLTNLPRGTYTVSAELQGFKTLSQSGILLTVGETVHLDFSLDVATVAETGLPVVESVALEVPAHEQDRVRRKARGQLSAEIAHVGVVTHPGIVRVGDD